MAEVCPCCRQPLPRTALDGVVLPPRKSQIYKLIERTPGITLETINRRVYGGAGSYDTIRVHICQINDLLAATDYRIRGNIKHAFGEYRIVKVAA